MPDAPQAPDTRRASLPRDARIARVLDTAEQLFYARGVHAVGMDELITSTGLAKMSVYRLFPTKDELVGAYLARLAARILDLIDTDIAVHADDPRQGLLSILDAIEADLNSEGFRGCPFGNAGSEYDDPDHPARRMARQYRQELLARLTVTASQITSTGEELAAQLAVLIDGAYLNAANLGPDGPAAAGLALARTLVRAA